MFPPDVPISGLNPRDHAGDQAVFAFGAMPRPDLFDVLVLLGLAVMAAGVAMWWAPAGVMVAGAGLLTVGVLGKLGAR